MQYQCEQPAGCSTLNLIQETSQGMELSKECSKPEARLTFHAKQEVPQLKEWFEQNQNPSERMFSCYADILNQSSLRTERFVYTQKACLINHD